jgi:tetratricopeptide (TPR) repeat protein
MNNSFQTIVTRVVSDYGTDTLDDASRCNALLKDYAGGSYSGEIRIFNEMLRSGYHRQLLSAGEEAGQLLYRLSGRLQQEFLVGADVAAFLISTLAAALGIEAGGLWDNGGDAKHTIAGDDDPVIDIDDLTQAIKLNPQDAFAYANRGVAYRQKDDCDRAIQDYSKAIQLVPNYAWAYGTRGAAYSMKGEYDRAIQDYSKAIALNPQDAIAYTNRGTAYYEKDDYDRAIQDYSKAIALNPQYAVAYASRGVAYRMKDDYDRAIQDYSKAIDLYPQNAFAYANRGEAYSTKGDYDRAIADYNQALKLDPNDADAKNNLEVARRRGR